MKKLGLLVMPLMAISFLASCEEPKQVVHYNFSLNGTGCTIFNDSQYIEENIEKGSSRKFTIVPDRDHTTPLTVEIVEGDSCASYEDGIITITNMDSDVVVTASAKERTNFDISVNGEHIHYYKDSGLEVPLETVKAKKGEDFVFYMFGEEGPIKNTEGYVPPTSLTIKIKDKIEDECYSIEPVSGEYENLLKKVTIYGKYITGDIFIQGDGVQKGYYQMRLPYLIGLKQPGIQHTFFEYDKEATFEFIAENSSDANDELLTAENIYVNLDGKEQEWINPSVSNGDNSNVTFEHTVDNHYYLHIQANAVVSGSTNVINVVARAKSVSILNSVGWSDISRASNKGYATALFDIGDTKNVDLVGLTLTHKVRIIDFNKDNLSNGNGKAGITFEFVDTIQNFTTAWNELDGEASTNRDFINRSNLNICLQKDGVVYKKIPSNLMDAIKTVTKSVETTSSYTPTNYNTKLFPLSFDELDGNDNNTYEYYKVNSKERRRRGVNYWLRNPRTDLTNRAWTIRSDGGWYSNVEVYKYFYAIAPAFCV